ncbi:glycosyltransferase family 2 protein [Methylomonas sp. MED-D]|uniref:glycosyltransferase family 2 protein n=1 Tax=unclassified Methylomonas TaxID=2608980 RepID=UPI0028A36D40|nr:glycosyltransferase family 2 protein [Methylomonas sp. MV1]MDT4330073.1 glycosyltransferase family 2 protein [Methylomonas sp. MV1]
MKIWICVPVFNRVEFTLKCLSTIKKQSFQSFNVVICDHGSTDGTTEKIGQAFPDIVVLKADSSLWWTGAINICVEYVLQHAEPDDFVLTLNNDTELPEDYLAEMAAQAVKYPHALLTSVVHDIATGKRVREGFRQSWWGAKDRAVYFAQDHCPSDENAMLVSLVSGRGTLIPVQVFRQVGLYDEVHLPHYAADYDFGHKARRAGYPAYVFQSCKVFSYVDATGMTAVRDQFSFKKLVNFLSNIKSPANLRARWWYGWNNCPRYIFPFYIVIDLARVLVGYFRYFIRGQSVA